MRRAAGIATTPADRFRAPETAFCLYAILTALEAGPEALPSNRPLRPGRELHPMVAE